jgi:putative mannosyl-glycoprotein endo-beta-N-acetylglucosaminidase
LNVRIRRYAEATNYAKVLTGVYNGIPKGENGMIIKYKNPARPIKYMGGYDKRGNMVLPVTNENGMNNVTLPEVTVTPRNINLAGAVDRGRREAAPYVSTLLTGAMFGPLPVLSEAIGSTTVDEATRELSKGKYNTWGDMMTNAGMNPVLAEFTNPGSYIGLHGFNKFGPRLKPVEDLAASGNKWARARVISKAIDKGTPSVEPLPNNVGWGPRQSIHVVHDKNSARLPKLYFPERWDAIHEGAPEVGIWYQGKFGNPRTAANHSIPGKAEKAAKARERFAKRPYRVEGDLELERPIVTVGDVPNRAALERAADKMSADGVIFNNVYDNGYSNNQVIFSLRDDLKNGRVFKKGAKPLEKSQFIDTGTSMNGDLDINKNIQNFVEYLLNPETQQRIASIDAELGTKYGEAAKRFVRRYNNGELLVYPRNKGDIGIYDDIINKSRTVSDDGVLVTKDFDRIAFEILRNDPSHVPGHEAKHGIELLQAALLKDMTPAEYYQYAKTGGPRLQALMKDNIVSEDEFVKRIMKEHPEYNEVSVRNKYKYLTIPSEFNSQLHPLIEFEQRAGKSGVPNFKSVDEIDRLINNNPYVGTSENNGLRNLRLLFNYIIKDKNEFMRRFNKYGFGTAVGVPTAATINNYDNEK